MSDTIAERYDNGDFVAQSLAEYEAGQTSTDDLESTRGALETPATPAPGVEADGAGAVDVDEPADDAPDGFQMTDDRRVGSTSVEVEGDMVPFGRPSGRASTKMLARLDEMEENGDSVIVLGEYVWATLAEWCLDDDRDADYWADELALVDAINTARDVALGGTTPGK